ncbi:alpha/beta hydrolase family protein [Nonomuraea soli]|uniref:Alpha-beta hydrolase superfamily lysophospholipase n=1 Tax=Nonomuraea soli TaxID=1032476 RepID=A0A7W0HVZ2_9ACTN|nr:alpha/beta fold hydrolase [Nonomuraea soli]MBA2897713.1 alpha-beta hydrolase superfamily lysophospholipase [Nonomuraea soli]
MFEYFPGNYVWNLSVNLALSTGAAIGEVDEACRPLRTGEPSDVTPERFFETWTALAARLSALARSDAAAGRRLSAAARYRRASVYFLTAERMQHHGYGPRADAYASGLDCFRQAITLGEENCEFVEVPYSDEHGDRSLPGLLVRARTSGEDRNPYVVLFNGLDSTKEMVYGTGLAQELARRGVSSLIIDQPGSGEALRLRGMTGYAESERYGSACVDYLESRTDCDPARIGVAAWSLGGYYAPRAAAFEPRFSLCVAWGAIYDWEELSCRRLAAADSRASEPSVPHFVEHILWVFGSTSVEEFAAFAPTMSLAEVSDRIRVPFLVVHGAGDRQIPVEMARLQYDAVVNSPRRELKVMTEQDGGVEHVGADNMSPTTNYIADWIADVFAVNAASC